MNKKFYAAMGIISILLYCILGFLEAVINKCLIVKLTVSTVSFSPDDYLLQVSPYKGILLAVAGVCIAISVISSIRESQKSKK